MNKKFSKNFIDFYLLDGKTEEEEEKKKIIDRFLFSVHLVKTKQQNNKSTKQQINKSKK